MHLKVLSISKLSLKFLSHSPCEDVGHMLYATQTVRRDFKKVSRSFRITIWKIQNNLQIF